jgi:Na+-translocating ferredoxin:NAD+ oxidoreductase RnfG subunit
LPSSAKVVKEERDLTDEQLHAVEKTLGTRLQSRAQVIYCGETNSATDGYAMIANEIGKEQFITFVVGITKEFKVQRVALMVFRESRGWEVEDPRFTGQFRGKTSRDRLLVGADIIGITGATLSARAFSRGTKKALAICEALYKH